MLSTFCVATLFRSSALCVEENDVAEFGLAEDLRGDVQGGKDFHEVLLDIQSRKRFIR